jgi:hypothetical protein
MVPMVFWYHKLLAEKNSLKLRFTEKKEVWNGIKWNLYWLNGLVKTGNSYLSDSAQFNSRTLRTSRRILRSFCYIRILTLSAKLEGKEPTNA